MEDARIEILDTVTRIAEPRDEILLEITCNVRDTLDGTDDRGDEARVVEAQGAVGRERGRRGGRDKLGKELLHVLGDEAELAAFAKHIVDPAKRDGVERVDGGERARSIERQDIGLEALVGVLSQRASEPRGAVVKNLEFRC